MTAFMCTCTRVRRVKVSKESSLDACSEGRDAGETGARAIAAVVPCRDLAERRFARPSLVTRSPFGTVGKTPW